MEFRIAPLILVIFNLVFISLVNPEINAAISLTSVSNIYKILFPFLVVMAMSIGAFVRHSYYSTSFKVLYYIIQCVNLLLAVYFVYSIRSQHLS